MNRWQVARQIKYLLANYRWSGATSGTNYVFGQNGSVHVTAGADPQAFRSLIFPVSLVRVGSAQTDPKHGEAHGLLESDFEITLASCIKGDAIGEHALIGANRYGGANSSTGRGLLELEEVLFDVIGEINNTSGIRIKFDHSFIAKPQIFEDLGYLVYGVYTFKAKITQDRL